MLLIINIRKNKESELSTILRIMANYLQLLSTSFIIQYPDTLTGVMYSAGRVGSLSDTFLSFDCLFTDIEITGPFASNTIFKPFLMTVLPVILFMIISMIWIAIYLVKHNWIPELKHNIVISLISIVLLLHLTLAKNSLSIFK